MSDDPVPAYQDPAIKPPVDMEQHLKLVDLKTAVLRAKLALQIPPVLSFSRSAPGPDGWYGDQLLYVDRLLRETGYFRLRYEEITR